MKKVYGVHSLIENMYFDDKGIKKVGYTTERGLIKLIKDMNKSCLKYGSVKLKLDITFPIKRSHNHKLCQTRT